MTCTRSLILALIMVLGVSATPTHAVAAPASEDRAAMASLVRADWEAQEKRWRRTPDSAEAIQAALERASRLREDLLAMGSTADVSSETVQLEQLAARATELAALPAEARRDLYLQIRAVTRQLVLKNPLIGSHPILFMQRNRAVGYMLYEYLGWYYTYGYDPTNGAKNARFATPPTGGGVYVLEEPGRSFKTTQLTGGELPPGHFVTLALSYDARTIYFAHADPSGKDPYDSPGFVQAPAERGTQYNTFHIFAMNADGTQLRQLTDGPHDDFDPCPLPDGRIAFESTRRGSKLRCGGGSPELVYTLHRMDHDGRNVRTLSFHETHEWHPSVLNDGRIIYTRWDYVDRNAAKFHGLWTCNLDGSNPSILFGNYTTRPWACYQAKAIPGSQRIAFVAGGHHANVGGTLMILDPAHVALDPQRGEDQFGALQCVTPEVSFAESESWPTSYFYSPWPLSEKYFLVAFSHDPLPGGYTGEYRNTQTGIYYLDCFGNLELLYRQPGISAVYPIPLVRRPVPPVPAQATVANLLQEGEFLLTDVQRSLFPLPADRRITQLRVYQLLPKSRTDNAADPRIGHPDQANARMLLGTVPVEDDGSAYFRRRRTNHFTFKLSTQRAARCTACVPWSIYSLVSVAVASAATSRRARLLPRDPWWLRGVHRRRFNPARMAHDPSVTRGSFSHCWTSIARVVMTALRGPTRVRWCSRENSRSRSAAPMKTSSPICAGLRRTLSRDRANWGRIQVRCPSFSRATSTASTYTCPTRIFAQSISGWMPMCLSSAPTKWKASNRRDWASSCQRRNCSNWRG